MKTLSSREACGPAASVTASSGAGPSTRSLVRLYHGSFTRSLNGSCTGSGTKLACVISCGSFHGAA